MALGPWIVRAPAGAVRLATHARIQKMTAGDVGVRPRMCWDLGRIALFAYQEPAKSSSLPELRIGKAGGHENDQEGNRHDAAAVRPGHGFPLR